MKQKIYFYSSFALTLNTEIHIFYIIQFLDGKNIEKVKMTQL